MKKCFLLFPSFFIVVFLMVAQVSAVMVSQKGLGEQSVLVIMAKFPDVEPGFSIEKMREKYFHKLNRYLRSVSYEKAWIGGEMTHWYTLPRKVKYYRISEHNLSVEKDRVNRLIQDAINLADKEEDFSKYSMVFISLGAKRKDYGMMGLCGYPGMLGWQSQLPLRTKEMGQKIPGGVAIYCENAHVGVVFHDMAHIMGGVQGGRRVIPCLYDHDLQAQRGPFRKHYQFYLINVGFFDPMSCHFYKLKQGPPGPCGWTKLRLDWIEPRKMAEVARGESRTLVLGPLGRKDSEVQVVKVPIAPSTYYLVENRQPAGPDRNLPSHGVLISFCDDDIPECRHGKAPIRLVNAHPSVPELRGAPFVCDGRKLYRDEKQRVSIELLGHRGGNLRTRVLNGVKAFSDQ